MAEHAVGIRTLGDAFYLRNRALDVLEEARIETDADPPAAAADVRRRRRRIDGRRGRGRAAGPRRACRREASATSEPRAPGRARPRPVDGPVGARRAGSVGMPRRSSATPASTCGWAAGSRRVDVDRRRARRRPSISAATVVSTVGNAPNPVIARHPDARDERGWPTPDATFALPGRRERLGARRLRIDRRSQDRPADAGDGPARHPRRPARRPQRPRGARRQAADAVLVRSARDARLDRAGSRPSARSWGSRSADCSAGSCGGRYYLLRLPTLDRRIRVALDWTLDLVLKHDIVEIGVRRTRARPGEIPGEAFGEPVSMGARPEAPDELVL